MVILVPVCLVMGNRSVVAQQPFSPAQQKVYEQCLKDANKTWMFDCECIAGQYPEVAAKLKAKQYEQLLGEAKMGCQRGSTMVDPYMPSSGNSRGDAHANRKDACAVLETLKAKGAGALPDPPADQFWLAVADDVTCRSREKIYQYALKSCPHGPQITSPKETFCPCYAAEYADAFMDPKNKPDSKSKTQVGSAAMTKCKNR
ncbi:MAG: hypothetical protein SFV52_08490 [Saprospiraceae bacterium]|nr:hypothetical protein [Saprospiraceae bacterium]